jgi:prolipoprotein diacylglyceryltransferase
LYVALYTFGRIWFEALRVDDATKLFGVRFNLMLSVVLCVGSTIWFVWLGHRRAPRATEPAPSVEETRSSLSPE